MTQNNNSTYRKLVSIAIFTTPVKLRNTINNKIGKNHLNPEVAIKTPFDIDEKNIKKTISNIQKMVSGVRGLYLFDHPKMRLNMIKNITNTSLNNLKTIGPS
jgi:hypothetical protein